MIIRIVKMTFQPERVQDFKDNFDKHKESIRNFEGCLHLELLQELDKDNVYFTYSWWQSPKDLENYRKSELFGSVWAFTKSLFADKPEAWSVNKIEEL